MYRIAFLFILIIINGHESMAVEKKAIALGQIQWQASLVGNGYQFTRVEVENMVGSLETMITTALTQSRKFEVIERF